MTTPGVDGGLDRCRTLWHDVVHLFGQFEDARNTELATRPAVADPKRFQPGGDLERVDGLGAQLVVLAGQLRQPPGSAAFEEVLLVAGCPSSPRAGCPEPATRRTSSNAA